MDDNLFELLGQIKVLAKDYYRITGKPLGVTAEIAEFEAASLTGVELCSARQPGYDAIRHTSEGRVLIQVKGCSFPAKRESGQRIGKIKLEGEWDAIMMVLLNPDFEPREIWEADRESIIALLSLSTRTDPGVRQVKRIGKQLWPPKP